MLHNNRIIHNVLVVKLAVSVGFVLVYFLPVDFQPLAYLSINFLWLWRT